PAESGICSSEKSTTCSVAESTPLEPPLETADQRRLSPMNSKAIVKHLNADARDSWRSARGRPLFATSVACGFALTGDSGGEGSSSAGLLLARLMGEVCHRVQERRC